jgi:hypothetical protein
VKTTGIVVAVIVLLLVVAVSFLDEPMRRYAERRANQALDGYTLTIGSLDFHPIGLSAEIDDVVLAQTKHPDQPIVTIGRWRASIHWRKLLSGNVVSDHQIERPVVHVTRTQAVEEASDERALKDRGWQQAVLEIYPLEINALEVSDGDVTYSDSPNSKPLRLQAIHFQAENIRNIESANNEYPSEIKLDARVFDSGHLTLEGKADFLATPHAGIDVNIELTRLPLKDLLPLAGRMSLQVRDGLLDAKGHVEYSPTVEQVVLRELAVDGLRADYVQAGVSATTVKKVAKTVVPLDQPRPPQLVFRVERGKITNSEIGIVNKTTAPNYRVFLGQFDMTIEDFSNRFDRGVARVDLTGRFMGNGKLTTRAVIRPQAPTPDFDLQVKILKTKLTSMNNVLRAHAGADVKDGTFAFFSELTVHKGKVTGYVRPFFKDVDVYNPEQDKEKGFLQQVYEGLIESLADVLTNAPRDQVATETTVTGPLSDPRASTWEVLVNLVKNAFFKAIVPGFKKSLQS